MAPHSSAVKHPSRAAPPTEMGAIAKGPPRKIRIVHVVEPTVIKTDARQFRELVQRLTGKPPSGVRGGGEGASSSSSAESASADSPSREAARGSGSSPDRAVVAPAAVKAEVKEEEEEDIAPREEEVFAHAFGEGLGDTKDWGMTEIAKAAVKEEVDGLAGAFGEVDDKYEYDAFFHGIDDFLLSNFQEDGFCL